MSEGEQAMQRKTDERESGTGRRGEDREARYSKRSLKLCPG